MLFVAAFAVSGYSGTGKRTNKPFNPLLGETFEFVCQEQGMRILIEKVDAACRARQHVLVRFLHTAMRCASQAFQ